MDFDSCVELLAARPSDAHAHCDHAQHEEEKLEPEQQHPKQEQQPPVKDGESAEVVEDQSARELVATFFRLQEQRVRIYADFHKGFDVHKKTPAFQDFTMVITQRFARISEQINRVEQALKGDKHLPALAQLVRKVQLEEKDKLLLTSAVLIEKMRREDAAGAQEPDESAVAFLERSEATLTSKHADCVDRINELLDELRIEAADLDDEDEDADDA